MQFSFLLISDEQEEDTNNTIINFNLFYASNNTRLKDFENPIVIDNKRDIDNAIDTISKTNLLTAETCRCLCLIWQKRMIFSQLFGYFVLNKIV